ncbi:hypothetical protein HOLleu_44304 [Holothuria leucospilota]|uniref:Uncharacterized protein n=1 Tax=Holothuria leucospilota TaxID=206669 RepID=A0A9Q0Y8Y0_HOLLE|nr:hypothetical protein HOLleu_44304 [Holothuria leucospilota]
MKPLYLFIISLPNYLLIITVGFTANWKILRIFVIMGRYSNYVQHIHKSGHSNMTRSTESSLQMA